MVNSFADNFWDNDFNGTLGYDTLVAHLKDGKKLYDAFSEFVRNRAKIEDDYGKSLIRLAQSSLINEEVGTIYASWEAVKKVRVGEEIQNAEMDKTVDNESPPETEGIGMIHCELSKQLNELAERCIRYRDKQKYERVKIDDNMKKEQKEKKCAYDSMFKAKRTYEQRCKESDLAKDAYNSKSAYTPKEEEKLKKNMMKAKSSAESADSSYQNSVKLLEDCRQKYILNMEDACQKFQVIEETRIQFLRNEMWLYTNHGAMQAVSIDERYEDCRKILEKCNEKTDIQTFINLKRTGSLRPSVIPYLNYYYTSETRMNIGSPYNLSHGSNQNLFSLNPQYSKEDDDVDNPGIMMDGKANKVRAAFDYDAQSSQELSLTVGDIIEIIKVEDDIWAIGSSNGKIGAFPLQFVDQL